MKLKKKAKIIIVVLLIILLLVLSILSYMQFKNKNKVNEVKILNKIDKYGYTLKDNKTTKYKNLFNELEKILNEKEVNEEEYVKKITEMFIYDFYSLNDKTAKTDIGGVEFVYKEILDNFLKNAQNTYYKYVESNIYNNRKQLLPVVSEINIESIDQKEFTYDKNTDDLAYYVKVNWTYTDEKFSNYQNEATLVFIHDDNKLSLVELQ